MKKISSNLSILLIVVLSAILSLVVLRFANPLFYPPGRDGGAYMFGGRHLLHGKILYVDYWEAKGPMIFLINTLGLLIGHDSRWGIWLFEFLFWAISALLAMITLKKQYGFLPGLTGVLVMMMVGKRLVGSGNYTEEYSLLFTWIAIFSFFQLLKKPSNQYLLIALGATLALNFFIRANNCVTVGVLILAWIFYALRTKGLKGALYDSVWITSGGLLIAIPITIYFLLQGTFTEMVNASIIYNFSYSFGTRPGFSNLNIYKSGLQPGLITLGLWMALPLMGFGLVLIQFIKHVSEKKVDVLNLALLILWPLEMLASSISGRNYGHYFLTWLPIMALLSAVAVDFILIQTRKIKTLASLPPWLTTLTLGLTTLLLAIIFNQDLVQYGASFSRLVTHPDNGVEYIHPISSFIAEHSEPDDLVLVWGGQTGLLFMSKRFSPTAYNFYPLYANSRIGREIQRQYFEDLKRNKPKLILDAHIHVPDALPSIDPELRATQRLIYPIAANHNEVLNYIVANYDLIHDDMGYQVYQIKEPNVGN